MWNARENGERKQQGEGVVAVAVDGERCSKNAVKWAVDNLFPRDQPLKLVHVVQTPPPNPGVEEPHAPAWQVLSPYRCFCIRKQVQYEIVVLQDLDVARALINYVYQGGIDTLLLGTSSRNSFSRLFKNSDIPSTVLKWASYFCNVYIISNGKVSAMQSASHSRAVERTQPIHNADPNMLYDELSAVENDSLLVSSERQSTSSIGISFYENLGSRLTIGPSSDNLNLDDENFEPLFSTSKPVNPDAMKDLSSIEGPSLPLHSQDYREDEITILKLDIKKAMDLYHEACKVAKVSNLKLIELQDLTKKQEQRMKEIELENARCKASIEAANNIAWNIVGIEIKWYQTHKYNRN